MKDRIKKILNQLDEEVTEHPNGFSHSGRHHYAHLLFDALSYEEQLEFEETQIGEFVDHRQKEIDDYEYRQMRPLNRPIEEVLEEFVQNIGDKKQQTAREQLYSRFSAQEWHLQLKILTTLTEKGTLDDLLWVVTQVQTLFSHELFLISRDHKPLYDEFIEKLRQACLNYISVPKIAYYLVGTADKEFLVEHQEILEKAVGYYKYARALAGLDRRYVIDRSKVDFFQYLDILFQADRPIKKEGLWKEFIAWLLSIDPLSVNCHKENTGSKELYDAIPSLLDFAQIHSMVKSCHGMELYDVICSVYDLDNHIRDLASIKPIGLYDFVAEEENLQEFISMAKVIAWEYEPNLLPDVTVFQHLQRAFNEHDIKVKTQEGQSRIYFKGKTCTLKYEDDTNNYWFEIKLDYTGALSSEQLARTLAQANEQNKRSLTLEPIDKEGYLLRSEIFFVDYSDMFKIMFPSQLEGFMKTCFDFETLLSKL